VSIADERPRVLVETSLGEFTIELDRVATPLHTANFLFYVDTGFYTDTLFHRIVCTPDAETGECDPFVAQGGGYQRIDGELVLQEPTRDPVASEAGEGQTSMAKYAVSLGLASGDPDSGASQFFVSLRDGIEFSGVEDFTVFGTVVDGTDVIDAMADVEVTENIAPPGEVSLPVEDVIILRMARILTEP
jgi:peptidyl-prolyl cis-trans isomerase A (cyclophilin A)